MDQKWSRSEKYNGQNRDECGEERCQARCYGCKLITFIYSLSIKLMEIINQSYQVNANDEGAYSCQYDDVRSEAATVKVTIAN